MSVDPSGELTSSLRAVDWRVNTFSNVWKWFGKSGHSLNFHLLRASLKISSAGCIETPGFI